MPPVGVCLTKSTTNVACKDVQPMLSVCMCSASKRTQNRYSSVLPTPVGSTKNTTLLSVISHSSICFFHTTVVSRRFCDPICCFVKAIPFSPCFFQLIAILDCGANRIHCLCKALLQSDWFATIVATCTTKVFYVPLTLPCSAKGQAPH